MSVKRSEELFLAGYNCAQAVFGGFAEELGLSEEQAIAFAACFGAGMCGTRRTCGAVSGALIALGKAEECIAVADKKRAYNAGKELIDMFEQKFGTIVCKELLQKAGAYFADSPLPRTEEYYKARPCLVFVRETAEYIEKRIHKK